MLPALELNFKRKRTFILHSLFYIWLLSLKILITRLTHIVTHSCAAFILIAIFYFIV